MRSWRRCSELAATRQRPTLPDIEAARARLDGVARVTPVYRSETLSRLAGRDVHLKAENLQRTGSFKIRGAFNSISSLGPGGARRRRRRRERGQPRPGGGVGGARGRRRRRAIFMPQDAPMAKVERPGTTAPKSSSHGETFEDALAAALDVRRVDGRDVRAAVRGRAVVIAGQGTIGLELAEQVPDLETVVDPDRRRRARLGHRARAARGEARRAHRRRAGGACAPLAGGEVAASRSRTGIAVKQPGRADAAHPARGARRHRHRHRRGDQRRRSCSCSSARSSSSRARAPSASRRSCSRQGRRERRRSSPCSRAATSTRRC